MYAFDMCNNFFCVNMYYVMHKIGGSQQIKFGETHAKSDNRTVRFGKPNHPVLLGRTNKIRTFDL
jgi:hypothetical protein